MRLTLPLLSPCGTVPHILLRYRQACLKLAVPTADGVRMAFCVKKAGLEPFYHQYLLSVCSRLYSVFRNLTGVRGKQPFMAQVFTLLYAKKATDERCRGV